MSTSDLPPVRARVRTTFGFGAIGEVIERDVDSGRVRVRWVFDGSDWVTAHEIAEVLSDDR